MEAFVYCWTDLETNKLYVGAHKGTSDDGYVCSSKLMLKEYKTRPNDFVRQIIATGSVDDMFSFEKTLLSKFNVKDSSSFYNQHNGDGQYVNKGHSDETIKRLKDAHKKRTVYAKGWSFTDNQKKRHLNGLRNFWDNLSEEERFEQSKIRETEKKKIATEKWNHSRSICPHCNKEGQSRAMKRWHFDNCRSKQ